VVVTESAVNSGNDAASIPVDELGKRRPIAGPGRKGETFVGWFRRERGRHVGVRVTSAAAESFPKLLACSDSPNFVLICPWQVAACSRLDLSLGAIVRSCI
jgi:hypothetical protein